MTSHGWHKQKELSQRLYIHCEILCKPRLFKVYLCSRMFSSGDSDLTASYSSVSDTMETENDEDFGAVDGLVEPYRFEPEAPEDFEEPHEDGD